MIILVTYVERDHRGYRYIWLSTEVYIICFDKYYSGGKEDEHWKVICYLSR